MINLKEAQKKTEKALAEARKSISYAELAKRIDAEIECAAENGKSFTKILSSCGTAINSAIIQDLIDLGFGAGLKEHFGYPYIEVDWHKWVVVNTSGSGLDYETESEKSGR